MYVCICNAVTEQLIREEAMSGVTEIKTLVQRFDVGSGCATCVTALKDVMHWAIQELWTATNDTMDGMSFSV